MVRSTSNVEVGSTIVEQFANLRADYDAARPSIYRRARPGILPQGSGADWHYRIEILYFGMMELARDIMRNNVVVGQGVRRFVANILQDGFIPDPETGDEGLNQYLSDSWEDWANDPDQCDISQEMTFHDMECMGLQNTIVDGDCFFLPMKSGALQMHEGHRCRRPSRMRRNVVHGIELDDNRRRINYFFTQDSIPLGQTAIRLADMEMVPARNKYGERQVFHLYRPDRMSQTRGVTSFAPTADTAGMGDDLCFAQLVKAQSAACWAILHEMASDATPPEVPRGTGEPTEDARPSGGVRRIEGAVPGMEYFGYLGEKLSGFSPNIPNPEFFHHAMLIMTFIAINLDMPLAMFLLDPTKTNFSGWRGAMDQAKMRFRSFQTWEISHLHKYVYTWKARQFIARDPAARSAAAKSNINPLKHSFIPPSWPYIQPMDDVTADIAQMRGGLNSPRRVQRKNSRDHKKVTMETIEDNSYAIREAKKEAIKINSEADLQDGSPVHWREILSMPLPEGMKISLSGTEPEPGSKKSADKKADKQNQDQKDQNQQDQEQQNDE
jgi:capsid protein